MSKSRHPEQVASAPKGMTVASSLAAEKVAKEKRTLDRLERAVGSALERQLPASELVPLLSRLVSHAPARSQLGFSARLMLAEALLQATASDSAASQHDAAWESARLAKALRSEAPPGPAKARCWAATALAFTVLGYYRASRFAYCQALKEDPGDVVCAHNLGHLLDVKLNQPTLALRWLRRAYSTLPSEREIAASYAYALVGCGQCGRAVDVLSVPLGSRERARAMVEKWSGERQRSGPTARG